MKNIMIIGAAIGDVLVYPASPEVFAPVPSCREILLSTGGDGLNEATVLAGLGKEPYLCTLLGRDQMGRTGQNPLPDQRDTAGLPPM